MNSKERGLLPAKGKIADRLPMWYGADRKTTRQVVEFLGAKNEEEAIYGILNVDYRTFTPRYTGRELKRHSDGTWDTIWGVRRGGCYGGHAVNAPLQYAETLEDVLKYPWPDLSQWDYRIPKDEINRAQGYCIIGGAWSQFFHDASELLGLEKFLADMYFNQIVVDAVIEKCFDFYFEQTARMFEENPGVIDIWFCGNDFGTQNGLLFSPEMWRKFFKPRFVRMAQFAHKNGALMALHSCGSIKEIIPDLIDSGIDILNPIQVTARDMDPIMLKTEFGKDIVFFGGIDSMVLINGTPELVKQETRKIIDILGSDGKYIIAPSHDYLLPEVPAENIVALYTEGKNYSTAAAQKNLQKGDRNG